MLFRQVVLPLTRSAIDHGNTVGLGPAADSPAESACQTNEMSVVQSLRGTRQIQPPDAESSSIVPRTKIAVQNDSVYAIVGTGEEVLIKLTESVCHSGAKVPPYHQPVQLQSG